MGAPDDETSHVRTTWPDAAIAELAGRQQGNVGRGQLRRLGVSGSAIDRAGRRGRLHRVFCAVYSVAPPGARPPLAAEYAALLACGPDAVLSHGTAAFLLGLRDQPREVHVTTLGGHRRGRPALIVHRTNSLARDERTKVGRLWVTSIPRTITDLARTTISDRAFERLTDEARKRVSTQKLAPIPRARDLLAQPSTLTWSEAEERLRRLIRRAGLPPPESNVPVGRFTPDLLWREQRLIVEYDGLKHHTGVIAFTSDRERRNAFELAGYRILHVTGRMLKHRPEQVIAQIATMLARRP